MLSEYLPANINQNIVQIRVDPTIAFPEYVNAYLNSKYGRQYLRYLSRQTEQVNLNCEEVGSTIVPKFSGFIQEAVRNCTSAAHKLQTKAKLCYFDAETILLNALSLSDFTPPMKAVSVKSFSSSVSFSGRLDAEYYQLKYDAYRKALKTEDTVHTLCNIHDKSFVPKVGIKYNYIELSNVGDFGDINNVEAVLGDELPSRARRRVNAGQLIIASVEGSLHSCALITGEYDGALCSTGFYIVDSEYINSESLLVLFKSEPIQALLQQRCSGTILTAITKDELLNMPLPKIGSSVQNQIAETVQESFALRHQSQQLLEYAKQAVEIAVEQGEEKAMDWLKGKEVEC